MTPYHYDQYVTRLRDLGEAITDYGMQLQDLAAEMRADPPEMTVKVPILTPEMLLRSRR